MPICGVAWSSQRPLSARHRIAQRQSRQRRQLGPLPLEQVVERRALRSPRSLDLVHERLGLPPPAVQLLHWRSRRPRPPVPAASAQAERSSALRVAGIGFATMQHGVYYLQRSVIIQTRRTRTVAEPLALAILHYRVCRVEIVVDHEESGLGHEWHIQRLDSRGRIVAPGLRRVQRGARRARGEQRVDDRHAGARGSVEVLLGAQPGWALPTNSSSSGLDLLQTVADAADCLSTRVRVPESRAGPAADLERRTHLRPRPASPPRGSLHSRHAWRGSHTQ